MFRNKRINYIVGNGNNIVPIQHIRRGSFGNVFEALFQITDDRTIRVAVKEVLIQLNNEFGTSLDNIENEIVKVQECEHKNVVKQYGLYFKKTYLDQQKKEHLLNVKACMIFEHCEEDLEIFLDRMRGQLDDGDKIDILIQLCRGIVGWHSKGIVHRDIKPNNVLVKSGEVFKWCDFGFAANVGKVKQELIGSMVYCPPELKKKMNKEDFLRNDVYSFALIAYRVLTGLVPFADLIKTIGSDNFGLLYEKSRGLKPNMKLLSCPTKLKKLLEKSLSLDPKIRPSSKELLSVLEVVQRDQIKEVNLNLRDEVFEQTSYHVRVDDKMDVIEDEEEPQTPGENILFKEFMQ